MDDVLPEQVLASRGRVPAGRFKEDLVTGQWWWSDETYRIYGFEPIEVDPTTARVLAHCDPEDEERVRSVLEGARLTGEPFATVYRIIDANGFDHTVLIVGEGRRDHIGDVVTLDGYIADLTTRIEGSRPELTSNNTLRVAFKEHQCGRDSPDLSRSAFPNDRRGSARRPTSFRAGPCRRQSSGSCMNHQSPVTWV